MNFVSDLTPSVKKTRIENISLLFIKKCIKMVYKIHMTYKKFWKLNCRQIKEVKTVVAKLTEIIQQTNLLTFYFKTQR